jgi:hypothetical protein
LDFFIPWRGAARHRHPPPSPISFYEIRCTGRPLAVAAIEEAAAAAAGELWGRIGRSPALNRPQIPLLPLLNGLNCSLPSLMARLTAAARSFSE